MQVKMSLHSSFEFLYMQMRHMHNNIISSKTLFSLLYYIIMYSRNVIYNY